MQCYDNIADVEHILVAFDFWVSGVVLFTVGLAGIIGNLLTLWVLSFGEDENRRKNSFNRLLVSSLAAFIEHRQHRGRDRPYDQEVLGSNRFGAETFFLLKPTQW